MRFAGRGNLTRVSELQDDFTSGTLTKARAIDRSTNRLYLHQKRSRIAPDDLADRCTGCIHSYVYRLTAGIRVRLPFKIPRSELTSLAFSPTSQGILCVEVLYRLGIQLPSLPAVLRTTYSIHSCRDTNISLQLYYQTAFYWA